MNFYDNNKFDTWRLKYRNVTGFWEDDNNGDYNFVSNIAWILNQILILDLGNHFNRLIGSAKMQDYETIIIFLVKANLT